MTREKRTYSGKLLDVDFYPVFADGRRVPSRAPKAKRSTEEQEKYNHAQAVRKCVRIINANFDKQDYFFHPTFFPQYAPQDEAEARRILRNYFERVKRRRITELKKAKKAYSAMPDIPALREERKKLKQRIKVLNRPFKTVCRLEEVIYKSGLHKGRVNWHYHIFVTGGLDDKTMERLWDKGVRVNCNNFQPHRFGPEAAAKYMTKSEAEFGKKLYTCSHNITKPKVPDPSKRDGRTSQYELERWAKEREDDAAFWERKYKGYKFVKCFPRKNPFNGRWYVSVIMYRTTDSPPPWAFEDWGVYE